jgi:ferric-dicitrate binding protein FerR (iron transport regulator)
VRHGCYKGSRLASLPVALGTRFADDPLLARAARIVTLNDDQRARYAAHKTPEQWRKAVDEHEEIWRKRGSWSAMCFPTGYERHQAIAHSCSLLRLCGLELSWL